MDQVSYLEKLLQGYRDRFAKGEKDLAERIRVTSAQLEELKLKQFYENQNKTTPGPIKRAVLSMMPRGCCRGR